MLPIPVAWAVLECHVRRILRSLTSSLSSEPSGCLTSHRGSAAVPSRCSGWFRHGDRPRHRPSGQVRDIWVPSWFWQLQLKLLGLCVEMSFRFSRAACSRGVAGSGLKCMCNIMRNCQPAFRRGRAIRCISRCPGMPSLWCKPPPPALPRPPGGSHQNPQRQLMPPCPHGPLSPTARQPPKPGPSPLLCARHHPGRSVPLPPWQLE